jgi:hypothetical protein
MSIFDFPRINFLGTIQLSPGTANNDDYAQAPSVTMPASWGPFAGQPFGLIDSKLVKPRTYGMGDEAFIAWVQQPQTFDGASKKLMPSEWNYYGDMSSSATTSIIGVETAPGKLYTRPDRSSPESALIGQALTFTGGITDINSEGSPPATQFFIDELKLTNGSSVAIQGRPSKGTSQWLNFFRNINRTADGGAGGYLYHVLLNGGGNVINIPGIPPKARGVIIRYYLYNVQQGVTDPAAQAELYKQKKMNPATLQIAGTIAPLRDDEKILTAPVGRLMISNTATIKTPDGTVNNGGKGGPIALAPAVLQQAGNRISTDFLGTFPEYFLGGENPKFDFGEVSLVVTGGGKSVTIGNVPYVETNVGNTRGWLFDFDISKNAEAQQALKDPQAAFSLVNPTYATVLAETPYYFVSNQQAVYAEQHGPGDRFFNQGSYERATAVVYHRGRLMPRDGGPPITVWAYQSTPIQSPGDAVAVNPNFRSGDPLVADTSRPGNLLFTFTVNDAGNPAPGGYPPKNYAAFSGPPWVTNAPQISARILPNDEDFSRYYDDPCADEPVGNALLTFQVVYEKVLRTYYLLFPAMNKIFPLNSEAAVAKMAKGILARTELALWMTTAYMPRTRDMSASRRKLLRAWCRKVLGT